MALAHSPSVPRGVIAAMFADLRAAWVARQARRAEYARVYGELSAYSDRELHDLGLARSDVARVARVAARAVRG